MVDLILAIPLAGRLVILAVIGALVGGQVNRGIYRLAWNARALSPWSTAVGGAARRWYDRLPIVGWLTLRREAALHGRAFWLRPMVIELVFTIGYPLLYWFETQKLLLWPAGLAMADPVCSVAHQQVLLHFVLLALMAVATFIDLDEQTIPDAITVTGTVCVLVLIAALPRATMPTLYQAPWQGASAHHLVFTSTTVSTAWQDGLGGPWSWPAKMNQGFGVAVVLACIWGWCFAIMHKTWTLRRGPLRAVRYLLASITRRRSWVLPLCLGLLLSGLTAGIWSAGEIRWQAFASAVLGMAFGGGLIWTVRIVAGEALQVEAMGFGDVTLMAMIGAFLGWQPALLVFFLAPFSAVIIALAQWLLTGDRHIAFGPYLCLSALVVLLAWRTIWYTWSLPLFALGWFVPGVVGCCLALMGGLLWFWRLIRDAIFA